MFNAWVTVCILEENRKKIIKNWLITQILYTVNCWSLCCQDFESFVSKLSRPRVFRQPVETILQMDIIIKYLNDKFNLILYCKLLKLLMLIPRVTEDILQSKAHTGSISYTSDGNCLTLSRQVLYVNLFSIYCSMLYFRDTYKL